MTSLEWIWRPLLLLLVVLHTCGGMARKHGIAEACTSLTHDSAVRLWVDANNGGDFHGCGLREDAPCRSIGYTLDSYIADTRTVLLCPGLYMGPNNSGFNLGSSSTTYVPLQRDKRI